MFSDICWKKSNIRELIWRSLSWSNSYCFVISRNKPLPLHRQMLAGAGAGTCQIVVTTPMELLKIQRQMAKAQGTATDTMNARALALKLYKEKGIFGFYKGVVATFSRDVVFSIMYFPMFAYFNEKVRTRHDLIKQHDLFFFSDFVVGKNTGNKSSPILSFIRFRHRCWCHQCVLSNATRR